MNIIQQIYNLLTNKMMYETGGAELIGLAVSLIVMMIAYNIGKNRNRNGWWCVVIVFFTGWIGLIFMALFLKKKLPSGHYVHYSQIDPVDEQAQNFVDSLNIKK